MSARPTTAVLVAAAAHLREYGPATELHFGLCYWLDKQLRREFRTEDVSGYAVVCWAQETDPAVAAFFGEVITPILRGPTPLRIEFSKAILACIERELLASLPEALVQAMKRNHWYVPFQPVAQAAIAALRQYPRGRVGIANEGLCMYLMESLRGHQDQALALHAEKLVYTLRCANTAAVEGFFDSPDHCYIKGGMGRTPQRREFAKVLVVVLWGLLK